MGQLSLSANDSRRKDSRLTLQPPVFDFRLSDFETSHYQMWTLISSFLHIGSPGFTPNASSNSGTFASGPLTRHFSGACTSESRARASFSFRI